MTWRGGGKVEYVGCGKNYSPGIISDAPQIRISGRRGNKKGSDQIKEILQGSIHSLSQACTPAASRGVQHLGRLHPENTNELTSGMSKG